MAAIYLAPFYLLVCVYILLRSMVAAEDSFLYNKKQL